jgi:DNA-binding SARP family transcriptional activator/tetratricopeptide (TPR) repeat protein/TolB-like protein
MAILALLARAGERGLLRDKVLALLWPDSDDERASRTLTQALYALRKDLLAEDAITGAKELRFDPALVSSDVSEFAAAVSRGDDARAAELYGGPFLDGFHLSGAEEFARWVDRERAALAQDHARALESLARGELAKGNPAVAVGWWRKLAALEPLNARVTVGLMEALTAAGDRASAIKQAHIYEMLVEQQLELPPDREVTSLAERLRQQPEEPASIVLPAEQPRSTGVVEEAPPQPAEPNVVAPVATTRRMRLPWAVAAVIVGVIGIAIAWLYGARGLTRGVAVSGGPSRAVVAVGRIVSYGSDSSAKEMVGPVSDLLATSLARSPGLRVLSAGRMMELMRRARAPGDTSGAFVDAARQAGATEVIEGMLYARPGGRLRLDLRRVDLATGAIGDVQTIEGNDLFALVDSGTARVVAALGARVPEGSVSDVTTRSVAAYRMYQQGMVAFFRDDYRTALRLFDGALAEDSLFALPAYYGAVTAPTADSALPRMERARRLAVRAPDRERLTILADWANRFSSPTLRPIAETLATRYPSEVEGHLYTGIALVNDGEFLVARDPLERVVAMDSLGTRDGPTCGVCLAMRWLVNAYALADSMAAAERFARRWLRLRPGTPSAVSALVALVEQQGRAAEADSLFRTLGPDRVYDVVVEYRAFHLIRIGDYEGADRLLAAQTQQGSLRGRIDAYWALTISLREQGRLEEALVAARRLRPLAYVDWEGPLGSISVIEAQVQLERGRARVAAALFDSIARIPVIGGVPSKVAREAAWRLTQSAGARAAAGDTASLDRLADSVRALGAMSGYGRDRRLYHYVRGLLLAARGDNAAAIAEFRAAIYSLNGYTRINRELATVLLRDHRARDAIAVLQPALHGPIEAENLYVNRVEIHELLARAWEAVGVADSAAAHYQLVARAWAKGDPPFKARADSARVRALRRS